MTTTMRVKNIIFAAIEGVLCFALPGIGPASAAYYYFEDISGYFSSVSGINDGGQVVGTTRLDSGDYHAALYTPGVGMIDLGTLGGSTSNGYCVNAHGHAVGRSQYDPDSTYYQAFLYTPETDIDPLGFLDPKYPKSDARGINDGGQIVGDSYVGAAIRHAFLYTPGTGITDIHTLGSSSDTSYAWAVNNSSQVTGNVFVGTNIYHAYVYTAETGMVDLDTLGGSHSDGKAINDGGQVTGYASDSADLDLAFLYTPGTGMIPLGTLGGPKSYGAGINDSGQVVGYSYPATGYYHAFIWDSAPGMIDLNGRVLPTLGLTLTHAYDINNVGQIVGRATDNVTGEYHPYLLTPALPGDANLDGTVDLSDLTLLGQNWRGIGKEWGQGDFNDDGAVDLSDLTLLGQNWRASLWPAGGGGSGMSFGEALTAVGLVSVPEPSTLTLLACGALALLAYAWRRWR